MLPQVPRFKELRRDEILGKEYVQEGTKKVNLTNHLFKAFDENYVPEGQPNHLKELYKLLRSVDKKWADMKKLPDTPISSFQMKLLGAMT